MKVLQIIHQFLDTNVAGSELYTYYLSRELSKSHDVSILYYSNDNQKDFFLKKGKYENISTYIINIPTTSLYYWSLLNYKNKKVDKIFKNILETYKPDIIHLQHLLYSSMNFPIIAKSKHIPTIHTLHDFYLICHCIKLIDHKLDRCEDINIRKCFMCILRPYSSINFLRKLVFEALYCGRLFYHIAWARKKAVRKVFQEVDLFISPSNFLKDIFLQNGLTSDKIIYSDNGMNYEIKNTKYNVNKDINNPLTFAYIGGHQIEKGITLLINAFNFIKNANLHIYGTGKEEEYKKLIKNPNIILKGYVQDDKKSEVFSKIDVLIVPSIWFENSPLTIHEAFMFNVPVITSNIGGMKELVWDGINGLHFNVGDVEDLRKKIEYFIENKNEVERMGKNVPKIKSIKENSIELENIYKKLVCK